MRGRPESFAYDFDEARRGCETPGVSNLTRRNREARHGTAPMALLLRLGPVATMLWCLRGEILAVSSILCPAATCLWLGIVGREAGRRGEAFTRTHAGTTTAVAALCLQPPVTSNCQARHLQNGVKGRERRKQGLSQPRVEISLIVPRAERRGQSIAAAPCACAEGKLGTKGRRPTHCYGLTATRQAEAMQR